MQAARLEIGVVGWKQAVCAHWSVRPAGPVDHFSGVSILVMFKQLP